MRTYPYVIENGAGERLTFARRIQEPDGDRLEGESLVSPGAGPPMHVHYQQEEAFTVVRGRLGYQRLGEASAFAEAGQSVVFRAGEPHRFWNAGEDDLHCTAYLKPIGNVEYILAALFESQRNNGGRRPNPFDVAFLMQRYRSEFGMSAIPAGVQQVVFPLLVAVGTVLGKYKKYADAPAPLDAMTNNKKQRSEN